MLYVKLRSLSLLAATFLVLLPFASHAENSSSELVIDSSESVIPSPGNSSSDQIMLTLRGSASDYYQIAWSRSRTVIQSSEPYQLSSGSTLIQSGRFDSSGVAHALFQWPANGEGSIYVQGKSSYRAMFDRKVALSAAKQITHFTEMAELFGVRGPTGATGAAGPQGPKGENGAIGPQGPQGIKGDTGAVGPMGPQGLQGASGEAGPTGPQGPQGLKGDDGAAGPVGPMGPEGRMGATGPQGIPGPTGPMGPPGMPPPVIMWSGGCSVLNYSLGWVRYCLNSMDFSTANDYLDVNPSGLVTVKRAGFYRINFWSIHNSPAEAYLQLQRNQQVLQYNVLDLQQNWADWRVDVTWPFLAGDQISIMLYEGGGNHYAYDAWRPVSQGAFSRLQVNLIGSLPEGFTPP